MFHNPSKEYTFKQMSYVIEHYDSVFWGKAPAPPAVEDYFNALGGEAEYNLMLHSNTILIISVNMKKIYERC